VCLAARFPGRPGGERDDFTPKVRQKGHWSTLAVLHLWRIGLLLGPRLLGEDMLLS